MVQAGGPATLLGVAGIGCVATWPFLRDHRSALAVQGVGAVVFAAHFALLGALTASTACGLSLLQLAIAISTRDRHSRRLANGLVLIALILLTLVTWHGPSSALVACGSVIGMLARCQTSTVKMKVAFVAAAPFWLAHNLIVGAPFPLAVDLISITMNLAGLFIAANRPWSGSTVIFPQLWRLIRIVKGAPLSPQVPV